MQNNYYIEMPKLVQDYLFYMLTIKGRSTRTVDGYAVDLRTFFRFIKYRKMGLPKDIDMTELQISDIDESLIKQITLSDAYEFLNYAMRDRANGPKARARKVSSLRGFFKYLTINTQILIDNPLKNLEVPSAKKSLPVYLSVEQSVSLLDQVDHHHSASQFRDYCIITLFLNCGMRLSELVGIDLGDCNIESGTLKLLGKGNKERIVYINSACKDAIDNYLTKERNALKSIVDKDAMFLSIRTGKRLGARQVQMIVSKSLKAAGLDNMGFSTHKLRHTAATLMYQEGNVDILVLKEMLGHANVGTTEIYIHVSNKKIQEASEKNPLANIKKRKP